jgi:hypothetical protein
VGTVATAETVAIAQSAESVAPGVTVPVEVDTVAIDPVGIVPAESVPVGTVPAESVPGVPIVPVRERVLNVPLVPH